MVLLFFSASFAPFVLAISGPFLDEVHGRLEERWFGANPRDRIQRPTSLAPRKCALYSALASVPALGAILAWWLLDGGLSWVTLVVGVPLPFLVAGLASPDYGRWLWWVVRLEGGTLWVSDTLAPITEWAPTTVLPPRTVALA